MGTGLTAPLRFVVRKSQKTLGQKKPSSAAAIWYDAAVRMMSRAQWFLMSFPIVRSMYERGQLGGAWRFEGWVERRGAGSSCEV